ASISRLFFVFRGISVGSGLCFCFTRAFTSGVGICLSLFYFYLGFLSVINLGFCSRGFPLSFFFLVALTFLKAFLNGFANNFTDERDRLRCVVIRRNRKVDIGRIRVGIYHSEGRNV